MLWVNFFFLNILKPFFACWQMVSSVDVSHVGMHIFLDNSSFITLCIIVLHFFLDMNSSTLDSQDSVRRKWAPEEDLKLVQALVEHYNEGNNRQETRLQPSYLRILEGKLSKTLPNAGIKAKPHIESRLKTLKKEFQIVHAMLCDPDASGFGWDNVRKCVVAEDAVWQAYVQVNSYVPEKKKA